MELQLELRRYWNFPVSVRASLLAHSPIASLRNWWRERISKLSLSKFLQLRFNLFLLYILPISFCNAYIWMLARLYFLCMRGQVNKIRRNVRKAMNDRTSSEVKKITRGVIRGIIHHYQEKMFNGFLPMPKYRRFLLSRVYFDEYEHVLKDALKEGRGVIIATGHFGALELLPLYLGVKRYNTAIVAKFTTERLKDITLPRAEEDGVDIIVPGDVSVFGEACRALRQNKIFVTQCDETHAWHADYEHTMSFLGRKIHPDRMLNVLCKRTRAVLLFGVLHRQGRSRYRLFLHRVDDQNGDEPLNIRTLRLLEEYIQRYPDQWYEWRKYHKFVHTS